MRIEISEPRSVSNGCRAKSLLLCLGLAFTFFVTAQAQPVITAQPANQVVVLGNTAVLAGSASGTGALTYRWQKNGTNLTDNGRLSGTTTPALSVATVQGSDAGQYRLVVSNSTAFATSSNATLLAVPVATWGVMRVGESNAPASATNVLAISCLAEHVLALRGDGRVVAWGYYYNGEIDVPPDLTNAVAVAAGGYFSTALREDGRVSAWGHSSFGETAIPPEATNLITLVSGCWHTLGLRPDGTVVTWSGGPAVPASATNVVAIAAGCGHSLVLRADGSVVAWGDNMFGQTNVPPEATNVVAIAADREHNVALRADGTLVIWGYIDPSSTNITGSASNVVLVAAGGYHGLASTADGRVFGWGQSTEGQINIPPNVTNPVTLTAGYWNNVALLRDSRFQMPPRVWKQPVSRAVLVGQTSILRAGVLGALPVRYQWLFNSTPLPGQTNVWLALANLSTNQFGGYRLVAANDFGAVTSAVASVVIPPALVSAPRSRAVPPGTTAAFTATASGLEPLAYQWQKDGTNLVNGGRISGGTTPTLTITNAVSSDGGNYRLVVTNAYGAATSPEASLLVGWVVVWGYTNNGATLVPPKATNVVAVEGGFSDVSSTCLALRSDGSLVTWGTTIPAESAIPAEATNIVAISVGGPSLGNTHSLALRADGTVLGWGNNDYSQATPPASATDAVAISAGGLHSLALRADGNVVAWGWNPFGQGSVPATTTNVVAISAGETHNLALRADGTVFGWGYNYYGQSTIPSYATNAVAVAAGSLHSLLLRADGTVVSWGYLGTNVPAAATNVVGIAMGGQHCLARRSDGTVVAWGRNSSGETTVPDSLFDTAAVTGGGNYSLALIQDKSIPLPPTLWKPPMTRRVLAGQRLLLDAAALGAPPLAFQWYLDGRPVPGQTNRLLALDNVQPPLAGDYTVAVTNSFGSVSGLLASLTVLTPPNVLTGPVSQVVVAGTNVVFAVTASGTLPLSYRWQKDGADPISDSHVTGVDTPTLTITGVQTTNAGSYRVVLSNEVTQVTSPTASLSVMLPPTIITQPVSQTVPAGSNTSFAVTVTGDGMIGFQWRLWQTNLPGQIGPSINRANVQAATAGDYDVVVSSQYGMITSSVATLTVVPSAPYLTTQPISRVVSVGQAVSFSVAARGTEPFSYQWQRNDTDLPGATGLTLALSGLHGTNAGAYRAALSNVVGTTFSTAATLAVVPVVAWGYTNYGLLPLPASTTNVIAVAAGAPGSGTPCLALRTDGTLVGWGYGAKDPPIPAQATNVVGMAIGGGITQNEPAAHSLVLRADGTDVAWGAYRYGQTNVPASATNVVAVAAGGGHCLALRADGTVIAWGANTSGQTNVPASATNIVAIAAGLGHSLALRANGTVLPWGATNLSQASVPADATNIFAISAQGNLSLALRADGKVFGWGTDGGIRTLPVPANATNIAAISAGTYHALALRRDGTILAWGANSWGQVTAPSHATNVFAIAAGGMHSLAVVNDATMPVLPLIGRPPTSQMLQAGNPLVLRPDVNGASSYQWQCDGTNIPGATTGFLNLGAAQFGQGGSFSLLAANGAGTVRSAAATILIWPKIRLQKVGSNLVATWEGPFLLQAANDARGPYLDLPDATSPTTNDLVSTPTQFFRLRAALGPLSISAPQPAGLVLDWPGPFTLVAATNVLGPYRDVSGATHPYTNSPTTGSQQFFRLRY